MCHLCNGVGAVHHGHMGVYEIVACPNCTQLGSNDRHYLNIDLHLQQKRLQSLMAIWELEDKQCG